MFVSSFIWFRFHKFATLCKFVDDLPSSFRSAYIYLPVYSGIDLPLNLPVQKNTYETGVMDYSEGVALSQQLSQVYLQSPLHHNNSEEMASQDRPVLRISDGGVNLADQENPSDYICSQDLFW